MSRLYLDSEALFKFYFLHIRSTFLRFPGGAGLKSSHHVYLFICFRGFIAILQVTTWLICNNLQFHSKQYCMARRVVIHIIYIGYINWILALWTYCVYFHPMKGWTSAWRPRMCCWPKTQDDSTRWVQVRGAPPNSSPLDGGSSLRPKPGKRSRHLISISWPHSSSSWTPQWCICFSQACYTSLVNP